MRKGETFSHITSQLSQFCKRRLQRWTELNGYSFFIYRSCFQENINQKFRKPKNDNKRRTLWSRLSIFNCLTWVWIISGRTRNAQHMINWSELFCMIEQYLGIPTSNRHWQTLFFLQWICHLRWKRKWNDKQRTHERRGIGKRLCNLTNVENPQKSGTLRQKHTHHIKTENLERKMVGSHSEQCQSMQHRENTYDARFKLKIVLNQMASIRLVSIA